MIILFISKSGKGEKYNEIKKINLIWKCLLSKKKRERKENRKRILLEMFFCFF